jgi:hypothetical protein
MVLELGGVKVAVTKIFPNASYPRRNIEVHHVKTRDLKYPFVPIFNGELGREYPEEELGNMPHRLRDFLDVYIRKCDFKIPPNLKNTKANPQIEMTVLDGPEIGKIWKMEKNLQYQIKVGDKTGKVPEVKTNYYIGKGITNDFDTGVYTSKDYQATVYFDESFGWCVKDEKYFWNVGPNFVYLANKQQLEDGSPSYF